MLIWIDLDNSPHAHFFAPIVERLENRGHRVLLTARRFGQVEEIANSHGLQCTVIGRHRTPRFYLARAMATIGRSLELAAYGVRHRPSIAVNHGSRAHVMAAWLLRVPVMTIYDYEFVSSGLFSKMASRILLPDAIPSDRLELNGLDMSKVIRYPGYKENVYLDAVRISPSILSELCLDPRRLVITLRPPATWAHYHSAHSEVLFEELLKRLRQEEDAQVVVLPRTAEQGETLKRSSAMQSPVFRILESAVDALSLMAQSDAVFSGGGTMIREAAIMGAPAYSIFAGATGAIDTALESAGKLTILRTVEQIRNLQFEKNSNPIRSNMADPRTREVILAHILALGNHRFKEAEPRTL
jgi:uncharacterized protein